MVSAPRLAVAASIAFAAVMAVSAQEPKFGTPAAKPGLFFRESWRQPGALDASTEWDAALSGDAGGGHEPRPRAEGLRPESPAASPSTPKKPPQGSLPRDWIGTSCVILSGYNQNPAPDKVVHGDASDPPNLWTGVCGAIAVTLRHQDQQRGPERLRQDALGHARVGLPRRAAGGEAGRRHLARRRSRHRRRPCGSGRRGHHRLPGVGVLVRQRPVDAPGHRARGDARDLGREAGPQQRRRGGLRGPDPGHRPRVGRLRQRRADRGLRQARARKPS